MAQLVAHLLCKQGVRGSSPLSSTEWWDPAEAGSHHSFKLGWARTPRGRGQRGSKRELANCPRASDSERCSCEADTRVPLAPQTRSDLVKTGSDLFSVGMNGLEPREGWTSGRKPRWGFRSGPVRGKPGGLSERCGREADTRVPLAPLSGGTRRKPGPTTHLS